jgi:hypothetical protein
MAPFREPLRVTLARTGTIAIVVGAVLAQFLGGLARWPMAALFGALAFARWPLGGGMVPELAAPSPFSRACVQVAARVGVWFVGGIGLAIGMGLTAMAISGFRLARWPAWWLGGLAFIGIELVAHLVLQLRGRPSFYSGRRNQARLPETVPGRSYGDSKFESYQCSPGRARRECPAATCAAVFSLCLAWTVTNDGLRASTPPWSNLPPWWRA